MHVNVILAHHPFQYPYIFRIANLYDQFSTSLLNVSLEYRITIFCHPYYVSRENTHRMSTSSLIFHNASVP